MQRGHREVDQAEDQRLIWAMHIALNADRDDLKRIFAARSASHAAPDASPDAPPDTPIDGDIRYL